MTGRQLADAYLDALARADLAAMLALFSEDALVHSPLNDTGKLSWRADGRAG